MPASMVKRLSRRPVSPRLKSASGRPSSRSNISPRMPRSTLLATQASR
ncbi:Uncharacterised protein [Bordetella pertussis]|nr:Uncharacterised protein [Bordetella pertussis]